MDTVVSKAEYVKHAYPLCRHRFLPDAVALSLTPTTYATIQSIWGLDNQEGSSNMELPDKYLFPEEDGLPMRSAKPYVYYKLRALEHYLAIANSAMCQKWDHRWYIDLQSGPGKNKIGNSVALGSPLIALTVPHPSTHFIFNEKDPVLSQALSSRVSTSSLHERVSILQADVNEVATTVCQTITDQDQMLRTSRQWSILNIAFLDPEGLELHWTTVEQLAKMKRMDLIINFSTSGILRSIGKGYFEAVTRFFGTPEWRKVYDRSGSTPRRALIDFYRQNLEKFEYHITIDPELGGREIPVNNSKNVQIYSLIFASKNEVGDRFWKQAVKTTQPPKLPGFD